MPIGLPCFPCPRDEWIVPHRLRPKKHSLPRSTPTDHSATRGGESARTPSTSPCASICSTIESHSAFKVGGDSDGSPAPCPRAPWSRVAVKYSDGSSRCGRANVAPRSAGRHGKKLNSPSTGASYVAPRYKRRVDNDSVPSYVGPNVTSQYSSGTSP